MPYGGRTLAFFAVILYGIVMTPETAQASRPDLNLDSPRVYFLYEDHIGRTVMVSEYEDCTPDGETPDDTFFKGKKFIGSLLREQKVKPDSVQFLIINVAAEVNGGVLMHLLPIYLSKYLE